MVCVTTKKFALLMTASAVALTGASSAQAQSSAHAEGFSLEEIIVTAGRREQSLQDVPASVTAVSPDDFKFKGMKDIKDVIAYTAGVNFSDGGNPGTGTLSARGVPQSSSTPVFGVYLDDTPMTSNTNFSNGHTVFLDGMLMDIERVEVIKGPQGTLYGATSVGGMLRYISRDPALEEYRFSAGLDISQIDGGSFGKTYNGRISAPLIEDKLGITVSGYKRDLPGYVDYVERSTGDLIQENADEGTVKGLAVDLLFRPTEELDIRLKYLSQKSDSDLSSEIKLADENSDDALWGKFTSVNAPSPRSLDYEVFSGTISYDFGGAELTSTTSRTEYEILNTADNTAAYAGFADQLSGSEPGTTTSVVFLGESGAQKDIQEIRLTSSNSDSLEWILGGFYTKEETKNIQDLSATPTFNMLFADFPSKYKEYAGFGDITYFFNENFDITGGVRISKNEINLNMVTSGPLVGNSEYRSETIKDTVKTYLLAGRYRINDRLSLYSRIASGFRPAQPNIPLLNPDTGANIAPTLVQADKAWSYEIGAKGETENGMFNYEVALWKIDWTNFQVRIQINGVGTGGNAENGLSAHGFEGTFKLRPTEALTLTGNVTYTKSTLDEDEPGFGGVQGENYPELPKWKLAGQWDYAFDVAKDWRGNFGGGLRYTDGYMSFFSASPAQKNPKIDSRLLADVNLGFSNDFVSIGVYATNLFNSRSLTSRADNILGGTTVNSIGFFERPRTIGANVRFDF